MPLNTLYKKTFTGGHASMAKFISELYKNILVCNGAVNSRTIWYWFNKVKWECHDSHVRIAKIISSEDFSKYYRQAIKYYKSRKDEAAQKLVIKLQKIIDSLQNDSEILKYIRQCIIYTSDDYPKLKNNLDQHKGLLCFENGVYDLDNNLFRESQFNDYITLSTGYDYIEYDESDPVVQEVFEFVRKIIPIPDVLHYLLKLLASCLSGYTYELLHIFIGGGANGKSTLIRLIESTLGELATSMKTTMVTQKNPPADAPSPGMAKTVNKRFVSLQEVNRNEHLNEALVKQMTGNDKLDFRQLYGKMEEFRPQFKMILCTNNEIKISGTDHGIWRRIRMVPFVSTFSETLEEDSEGDYHYVADKSVMEKIDTIWRPAFFKILIKYYYLWKDEGLSVVPNDISKYTKEFQEDSNLYQNFITEYCEVSATRNDHTYATSRKDLKNAFTIWKNENNLSREATEKELNKYISAKFGTGIANNDKITVANGSRDYGWYGIRLKAIT
jgi:P4 family phage/plasmid primase-like protien